MSGNPVQNFRQSRTETRAYAYLLTGLTGVKYPLRDHCDRIKKDAAFGSA
jgi:hypothetical protein